jgi:hypothetical protein
MVQHATRNRSYHPDIETYDDAYDDDDDEARDHPVGSYKFGRSAKDHSIPLFLSDPDGEPDPEEFAIPSRKSRTLSISSKILAGVLVAAAMAILYALFSSDDMRNIAADAKASFAAVLPWSSLTAQPDPMRLTAKDIQLKDPARLSGPANQIPGAPTPNAQTPNVQAPNVQAPKVQAPGVRSMTTVAMAPSREEISTAYQSAAQNRAPAAVAPAAAPAPTVRRSDSDEVATLMTRAKGLLAAGDIPSARLLLQRAADAREPTAALLLAQTYDPAVLGTRDARNIVPDPALARTWYQRAAELGSAEAQRGLQPSARQRFEKFLQQDPETAGKVTSDADREALFKQFQAWEAERNARAQVATQAPQVRPDRKERQQ